MVSNVCAVDYLLGRILRILFIESLENNTDVLSILYICL